MKRPGIKLAGLALIALGLTVITGTAASFDSPAAKPEESGSKLTMLYTINNVGYIEPCG